MLATTTKAPSTIPRIETLDSLRGLAALSVINWHTIVGLKYMGNIAFSPFYILVAGNEAVIFFFVLSGYVLVNHYQDSLNYPAFLVQRTFRIYIPYIISIALAIILMLLCHPHHLGTVWIHGLWGYPLSVKMIIKHIIMVGNFGTDALNPVIWSLVHEMRFAIIFPLILWVLRLRGRMVLLIMVLVFSASVTAIIFNINYSLGYHNSYAYTLYYLNAFCLGGLLAKHQAPILKIYSQLGKSLKLALLVLAFVLYNYAYSIPVLAGTMGWQIANSDISTAISDLVTMLISLYFIVAAIAIANKKTILTAKFPLFLGRISYSLYLVHVPVLGFIYFTFYNKMPILLVLALGYIASFLVAIIFNRYIEQPSAKLFRRLFSERNTPLIT